ncbi:uncharacterized protein LOC134747852, partial [Cydia strobilella]|uniref:uncharacterized protein LOC134747852 n=1 Tax=Cydia strobilella TaxID=1100964 RepID=UPI0030077E84
FTTDFICAEQQTHKSEIADQNDKIKTLEQEKVKLQASLRSVSTRLSTMENISRSCNLELQAVPEKKNENVMLMFKNLCSTINMSIAENNIIACRRVAKMDTKSSRPRNILVSLSSPLVRDTVLAMASRHNKAARNSTDPTNQLLNSMHLGITGESKRIYVVEHLSPECKTLYAETRKVAKSKGYNIVWTRYGKIYVRRNEQSDAIHIKDANCLNKL